MQRWHLTLLLGAGAIAAVALAPSPGRFTPISLPSFGAPGDVQLDVALDRSALRLNAGETRNLVVTLTAPEARGDRVPVDVALVVDVSGSMGQGGKIEQAREAAHALVDALRPGDRFALVAFEDSPRVLAQGTALDEPDRLHGVIDSLRDGGGTNLYAGLEAGLGELDTSWAASKVLVVSDGNANVGVTEPSRFDALSRQATTAGITVSTIGLGRDFNETLLEGMADAGGGAYQFVGHATELPGVIAQELAQTTELVARGATVHLALAGGAQIEEVYGWSADVGRGGADVYIGDLSAGQTRKIVLRVSIPDDEPGTVPVATATLNYTDVDGTPHADSEGVEALVSRSAAEVDASVDAEAAAAAARARASAYMRSSAEASRSGDAGLARRHLAAARDVVLSASESLSLPELADDAAHIAELQAEGAREGDAYAAKAASAASRDYAR